MKRLGWIVLIVGAVIAGGCDRAERAKQRQIEEADREWRNAVNALAKAKRAYGWSHPDGGDNKTERFVAVLEIPPVTSPQTAVKMSIYSDIKKGEITPSHP